MGKLLSIGQTWLIVCFYTILKLSSLYIFKWFKKYQKKKTISWHVDINISMSLILSLFKDFIFLAVQFQVYSKIERKMQRFPR